MSAPTRPTYLRIENDPPTGDYYLVPLRWDRSRTGRHFAYLHVGDALVSFYVDPASPGRTLEIRTGMLGHRIVPRDYNPDPGGDKVYLRYVDPADQDRPAVRRFLAEMAATALRAIRRGPSARN